MRKAKNKDRENGIHSSGSFKNNKMVNYITGKKEAKVRFLMRYSLEYCMDTGEVIVSDDEIACATILFKDRTKF